MILTGPINTCYSHFQRLRKDPQYNGNDAKAVLPPECWFCIGESLDTRMVLSPSIAKGVKDLLAPREDHPPDQSLKPVPEANEPLQTAHEEELGQGPQAKWRGIERELGGIAGVEDPDILRIPCPKCAKRNIKTALLIHKSQLRDGKRFRCPRWKENHEDTPDLIWKEVPMLSGELKEMANVKERYKTIAKSGAQTLTLTQEVEIGKHRKRVDWTGPAKEWIANGRPKIGQFLLSKSLSKSGKNYRKLRDMAVILDRKLRRDSLGRFAKAERVKK